jgi:hypothetical protein
MFMVVLKFVAPTQLAIAIATKVQQFNMQDLKNPLQVANLQHLPY